MIASIYLDDELRGKAYEVRDVIEDGMLPSEVYSKLVVSKMLPEFPFRICRMIAHVLSPFQ